MASEELNRGLPKHGNNPRPHVVALPFPMQGHLSPMIHLCKHLVSLGLTVSLVNTQSNHDRLARSAAATGGGPAADGIAMLALPEGDDASHAGGGNDALQRSLIAVEAMEAPFEALLQGLAERGLRVDCIVSDAFLGWSQDVADRFGIPRAALWGLPTEYCLINFHLPELHDRGYAPIRDRSILDDPSHTISFIDGVAPLHPRDLPSILQIHSDHDPGFAKRYARTLRLREAAWILANTFQDLEPDAVRAMETIVNQGNSGNRFLPVGPLLPLHFLGLDGDDLGAGIGLWIEHERCVDWLDNQTPASVIYICFGSVATISAAQMAELAAGIESTRNRFLWVIRPSNIVEGFFDLDSFVERTKGIGLVVEWAPQLQVLFHPSVGGFLSHCGWNSIMESITMGVPLIGMPCIAEQNMNCKRAAVDWGVGCRLARSGSNGIVTREEIYGVVTRFMTGQEGMEMRIRARELRESARRCVGSSRKNLESFVEAVVKIHDLARPAKTV